MENDVFLRWRKLQIGGINNSKSVSYADFAPRKSDQTLEWFFRIEENMCILSEVGNSFPF